MSSAQNRLHLHTVEYESRRSAGGADRFDFGFARSAIVLWAFHNVINRVTYNILYYTINAETVFGDQCQKINTSKTKRISAAVIVVILITYCRTQLVKRRGHARDNNNARWHYYYTLLYYEAVMHNVHTFWTSRGLGTIDKS